MTNGSRYCNYTCLHQYRRNNCQIIVIVCVQVVPEPIDHRVAEKIRELVQNNTIEPGVIKSHIGEFVRTICATQPHPSNKRFYPSDKTIRNHVYKARTDKLQEEQSNLAS
ncbi:hypothetical protein DPMN_145303 [Dreissena polymorpha]|uniref:Uncharacterized protein n=1 Tax=Dreissena polymorpha TaxID=45954 RepID=A0A9D4F4P4_DREPO|nr:hypothetical protein DPMN_145303 [Dreissena polymorpha]